ncbi:hypothetical protein DY000_02011133 [Brassica cretica]|uniref:Uncharacterized protein n=1 Tax=Brassica cretica TaxID=69181 RepID=A0ABQ7D1W4_BRACR|nr:hypothetical protein DY000_02011133 [Brassica cretica]
MASIASHRRLRLREVMIPIVSSSPVTLWSFVSRILFDFCSALSQLTLDLLHRLLFSIPSGGRFIFKLINLFGLNNFLFGLLLLFGGAQSSRFVFDTGGR